MKKILLLIIVGLSICNVFAQDIAPQLIEINNFDSSYPRNLTNGGNGKIYFSAVGQNVSDRSLFVYDEATLQTYSLETTTGLNTHLDNGNFKMVGDVLYYTVTISAYENILCRSNGTQDGTYAVKAIIPNGWENAAISNLTAYNDKLYFTASDGINGNELWVSDGTETGTHIVKDIYPGAAGSGISSIFEFNGSLYFTATTSANGTEIWKSDGTEAGTVILKDILSGSRNGIQLSIAKNTIVLNDHFYFYANNGTNGYELWSSDGTTEGTQLFKEFFAGTAGISNQLDGIAVAGSYFVFMVSPSANQYQLWKSDGTVAGTVLLKTINSVTDGFVTFNQFVILNNTPYFVGYSWPDGSELWKTDGTAAGTVEIINVPHSAQSQGIVNLTASDNYLIFCSPGNLGYNAPWISDGTASGTNQLNLDLTYNSAGELSFVPYNGTVYFQASSGAESGMELWATNGSANTTYIVKDIFHRYSGLIPGAGAYAAAPLNDKMVFVGNNGVYENQPFVSDGTINNTAVLKDVNPSGYGLEFTNESNTNIFIKAGNKLYFNAFNAQTGREIYSTDGTTAGTALVKDIRTGNLDGVAGYTYFMEYNGIFYFKANDGVHGNELWRTDGTEAGTFMVKDINPGAASGVTASNSYTYTNTNFAVFNGYLYFMGEDAATGYGVWRTDGTEAGTEKVITLLSSDGINRSLVILGATNDKIFLASEYISTTYGLNTLWSSDGTQNGTIIIHSFPFNITTQFRRCCTLNNVFYYGVYNSGTAYSIFKTTGAAGNNELIKGNFGEGWDNFSFMQPCGNYVYFGLGTYSSDYSNELWRTDGTYDGTISLPLNDEETDNYSSTGFTCFSNNLLFIKPYAPNELWITDGTTENTQPISMSMSNVPKINSILGIVNNKIYLEGMTPEGGSELYVSAIDNLLSAPTVNAGQTVLNDILLYPNPGNDIVTLSTTNNTAIKAVAVYDLSGKKVLERAGGDTKINVSVGSLSKGIYLVKVKTITGTITKKLIRN